MTQFLLPYLGEARLGVKGARTCLDGLGDKLLNAGVVGRVDRNGGGLTTGKSNLTGNGGDGGLRGVGVRWKGGEPGELGFRGGGFGGDDHCRDC